MFQSRPFQIVFLLVIFGPFSPIVSIAQIHPQPVANGFKSLSLADEILRNDIVATEQALDLVQASLTDSTIENHKQRHKGFGGWMLQRVLARYWVELDTNKRKYIGTTSRHYKIYDGVADEFDMNIFLMPHLPQYVEMAAAAFEIAQVRPRGDHGFRVDAPENYPLPEALKFEDKGYFTIECELTPPIKFREVLDQAFLPMAEEGHHALETHPNFGQAHPSFGMTGVWCLDCNHNCRPEIHPIEWLWWLDMSENRWGSPNAKSWMVGLMNDASNRFNDWSKSPKMGSIALPFVLPADTNSFILKLDLIAADPLQNAEPAVLEEGVRKIKPGTYKVVLAKPNGGLLTVFVYAYEGWNAGDFAMQWENIQFDAASNTITGFLRLNVAIETTFAARITFDY